MKGRPLATTDSLSPAVFFPPLSLSNWFILPNNYFLSAQVNTFILMANNFAIHAPTGRFVVLITLIYSSHGDRKSLPQLAQNASLGDFAMDF